MKLKICGIRNQEMLNFCQEYLVDFCGINFISISKRKVGLDFVQKIPEDFFSKKVALFMDQSFSEITHILDKISIDIIQLHGNEPVDLIEKIKQKYPDLAIWKVFCIDKNFNKNQLYNYQKISNLFLFDAQIPGSGKVIENSDQHLLQVAVDFCVQHKIPYAIAGGINIKNIEQFKKRFPQAQFLDTASGVETDGKFDKHLAEKLIELAYGGNAENS